MATTCRHSVAKIARQSFDNLSIKNISHVELNLVLSEDREKFFLKCFVQMMLCLLGDVVRDSRHLGFADRKRSGARLPFEFSNHI